MKRLVIDGFGKYLGIKDNQIIVKEKGKTVLRIVPDDLRQVIVTARGSISFDAIKLLANHGVDLIFLDWQGNVESRLSSPTMRTVLTRKEQYYAYNDERGVILSKAFVYSKLRNQGSLLGTMAKSRKETDSKLAEKLIKARDKISERIEELKHIDGENVDSIRDKLFSLEGTAGSVYWKALEETFPKELGFKGRSGRYATDPINSMLNYGYGILLGETERAVHFSGLDPYGGFLHVDRPGKPSMVLDLMEEFRQQLIDKTVIRLVEWGQVSPTDFTLDKGLCRMNDNVRRLLLQSVLEKLDDYVRYEGKKIRWSDLILSQARSIAKFLRGESPNYVSFWLRW